ncbi:MAG: site-specific integrase [Bacteroidales bacterium]|nr:site-specific integrase [Bacteroidales bacterium]
MIAAKEVSMIITHSLIEQFLLTLKAGGRKPQTLRTYSRGLLDLYDFLPEEKEITKEILEDWRESLKQSGYKDRSVNTKLVAVNSLLRYCGRKELFSSLERLAPNEELPEMTREEYRQFLSRVRALGSEKSYFLIKVFASVDISIGELPFLTVKACREGILYLSMEKIVSIPGCLQKELLDYADRQEITEGPIFVTREGNPMDRSNISNAIRRLALQTGMDAAKCCPSALHRLYLTTQRELREQLHPHVRKSYESLLNTEQGEVAWL